MASPLDLLGRERPSILAHASVNSVQELGLVLDIIITYSLEVGHY